MYVGVLWAFVAKRLNGSTWFLVHIRVTTDNGHVVLDEGSGSAQGKEDIPWRWRVGLMNCRPAFGCYLCSGLLFSYGRLSQQLLSVC